MFLKSIGKFNPKALVSFSFFTILSFFGAALIFNFPAPAVYGAGTAGAWNLERVGTDLNVYYSTGGANALILKQNGEMQARKIYDIDNTSQYFLDPSLTSSLNTLGIGITAPAYKLQSSSGFPKTDTNNRVISMFGSNEGTTSWGLKMAMTGAATTAASSLVLQTGDNATNNGSLGLQSYGGNVGIGTTAPSTPLEVWYNTATPLSHGIQLINRNTTAGRTGDITLGVWDGANYLRSRIYHSSDSPYGWTDQRLTFATQATGADNYTDTMSLKNGQVGIGTIAPAAKLDVSKPGGVAGDYAAIFRHTGSAGNPGTALAASNGYPTSQGSGFYELLGVYANNFAERILTIRDNGAVRFDKGNIHMPRFDATPGFYGISSPDLGYFPDGTPYYMGFGREAGPFDGTVVAGSAYPDLVISNHTGIKLVGGYGYYGGVSVYDNYNYANATWPGVGTEVARFRATAPGGSYFTSNLGVNMSTGPSYPLHVGGTANVPAVRIEGLVGINGYAPGACGANYGLCVGGPSGGQSIWNNTSDVRLKENITVIPNALEKVMSLRGVYFNFKDLDGVYKTLPKGRQVGFIAQEVEPILPEVVSTGSDGMKMMGYGSITALLTEATKELNQKLERQQAENKQLREDVELLKKEIQLIKEKK